MIPTSPLPYLCPGESQPISRSVHLGRLARFYPSCLECPHRNEPGALSTEQAEQWSVVARRGGAWDLWDAEGLSGAYLNHLQATDVRRAASALGELTWCGARADSDAAPSVVLASDGRPLTAELAAAAIEGLRRSGCHVIDLGRATSACALFAMDHLATDGGMLIGNADSQPERVGVKFWADAARPVSSGGRLEQLATLFAEPSVRPVRPFGALRRFNAELPYLACLHKYFHALRPLRFVVDTTSEPLAHYLRSLATSVACDIVTLDRRSRSPATGGERLFAHLSETVTSRQAHFGIWIDGDGEACRCVDGRGCDVPPERLFLLLARHLLQEHPGSTFILEEASPDSLQNGLTSLGARTHRSHASREAMEAAIREHDAMAGGGPSGQSWFHDHRPASDALKSLAILLTVLSQSDRDLAQVLEADSPNVERFA